MSLELKVVVKPAFDPFDRAVFEKYHPVKVDVCNGVQYFFTEGSDIYHLPTPLGSISFLNREEAEEFIRKYKEIDESKND